MRKNKGKQDLLPALTGFTGGNEYMISVKQVQMRRTTFENKPMGPIQKGP